MASADHSCMDTTDLLSALMQFSNEEFHRLAEETPLQQRLSLFSSQNERGETVLHYLAGTIRRDRILWVLESIDQEDRLSLLRQVTDRGQTVVHLLALNAQLALILAILDVLSVSTIPTVLKLTNSHNDNVAHSITKCGTKRNIKLLAMIMDTLPGNARSDLLKSTNEMSYTVIQECVKNGDLELAACFIKSVAERDRLQLLRTQTSTGRTVIHMAVEQNDAAMVQELLSLVPESAKASLLAVKSQDDRTALNLAVKRDFTEPIRVLFPYSQCMADMLLHRAAMHGSANAVRTILEEIVEELRLEVLLHQNEGGRTPLHLAVKQGSLSSVVSVLDSIQKRDRRHLLLKVQDHNGNTVLHLAITHGLNLIMRKLLESVSPEDRVSLMLIRNDDRQDTAFHLATRKQDWAQLTLLMEMAEPSQQLVHLLTAVDHHGETVLQGVLSVHKELASYLLNRLSSIDRLNAISKVSCNEARSLLNLVKFSSSEAKELATRLGTDGNTFLHLTSRLNHHESTERFLLLLSEEERIQALTCPNRSGKTAYKIAKTQKLKDLLTWAKKQKGSYYMPTFPQILIMYSTKDRPEAQEESDRLEQVLAQFRLKPIVKKDLTADEMLIEIRNVASSDDDISGLIVVVMSHGEKGAICAEDKNVRFQDILSSMDHPALKGKPKVLLAQSCLVQTSQDGVRLQDHRTQIGFGENSRYDPPAPGRGNRPTPVVVTEEDRKRIFTVVTHFFENASQDGAVGELPIDVFDSLVPQEVTSTKRAAIWRMCSDLLVSLRRVHAAFNGKYSDEVATCSSSNTVKTHYDLQQRDVICIMATVNGGTARRCELIPTFARYLQDADADEDIYNIFLKTHEELERKLPDQVLELRSTLTKKLRLKDIINSSSQVKRSPPSHSLFSCVQPQATTSGHPFGAFRRTM